MAGGINITSFESTQVFEKDYSKLTAELQGQVDERLKDLLKAPRPAKLNFEKLRNYKNPNIYTIHITNNCSHKLSMEIAEGIATLRRVRKHGKIDLNP